VYKKGNRKTGIIIIMLREIFSYAKTADSLDRCYVDYVAFNQWYGCSTGTV